MHNWRLNSKEQTLVLSASDQQLPQVVCWAARLPEKEDLEAVDLASTIYSFTRDK